MSNMDKYDAMMEKEPCRKLSGLEEISKRISDLGAAINKAADEYREMNDVLVGVEAIETSEKIENENKRGAIGEILISLEHLENLVYEVEYQNSRLRGAVPLD